MDQEQAYPFVDSALARRLERTEAAASAGSVECRARLFPEVGAEWIEVAGAYAMFDGVASPLTQTFGLGVFDAVRPEHLDRIESFYRARGAGIFHEVSPVAPPEVLPLLTGRGYRPVEQTNVMFRPIFPDVGTPARGNEQVEARPIRPGEEEVWAQTSVRGWVEFPEYAPFMLDLGRVSARRADATVFFAELGGEPVATALLSMHGGVALLGGASTVPEGRCRGAQTALMAARLRFAVEHGCDLAMMGAAPGSASQRNAERQGFRIAYTRVKWHLPDA